MVHYERTSLSQIQVFQNSYSQKIEARFSAQLEFTHSI